MNIGLYYFANDIPSAETVSAPIKKKRFIYLFIHDRHREREAETQEEGEAGSMHREPDVGLDPGTPGSRPGPKAGAKPLSHPGIPYSWILEVQTLSKTKIYSVAPLKI